MSTSNERIDAFIEVTVINWDKYNPRKDNKKHTWFRFENDLLDNPDWRILNNDQIILLIYILSQCSKRRSGRVRIYPAHAASLCRVTVQQVMDTLGLLSSDPLNLIETVPKIKPNITQEIREVPQLESNMSETLVELSVVGGLRTNERTNEEEEALTSISVETISDAPQPEPEASSPGPEEFQAAEEFTVPPGRSSVVVVSGAGGSVGDPVVFSVPPAPPPQEAEERDQLIHEAKKDLEHHRRHVSNAQVQETSMSPAFREFTATLAADGYKLTPSQKRKLPRSFAEWGEDLDAVSEFIASKYKYAVKTGRSVQEAERYAINAFIGEATQ